MITVGLADVKTIEIEKIGGIKIRFGNRTCYTGAFVLSGKTEPIMCCLPLQEMDLIVIPTENKLEYNHKEYEGGCII